MGVICYLDVQQSIDRVKPVANTSNTALFYFFLNL